MKKHHYTTDLYAQQQDRLLQMKTPPDWFDKALSQGIFAFDAEGDLLWHHDGNNIVVTAFDWIVCMAETKLGPVVAVYTNKEFKKQFIKQENA